MKLVSTLALLALGLGLFGALPAPARADDPGTDVSAAAGFDQKLGAQVPLDAGFVDESGRPVRLGDYLGSRPLILTLNYLRCPNLCSLELDQLTGSLSDLPFNLGDEYAVITVSIDPRDTPEYAAEKKWQYVRSYARPGQGDAWHFLTGREPAIRALADSVGFYYAYDAKTDEYAHPIGIVILTPEGRVARYIYGVDYPSRDLRLALVEASENKIGSAIDQILLLCYRYDPAQGRYSTFVLNLVRVSGILTVLGMGLFIGWLLRKDLGRPA